MQSDFFTPMQDTINMANRWCRFESVRDCVLYFTNMTLSDMVASEEDRLEALLWNWDQLDDTYEFMIDQLEYWEQYELCHKVKLKHQQFEQELKKIAEHMEDNI